MVSSLPVARSTEASSYGYIGRLDRNVSTASASGLRTCRPLAMTAASKSVLCTVYPQPSIRTGIHGHKYVGLPRGRSEPLHGDARGEAAFLGVAEQPRGPVGKAAIAQVGGASDGGLELDPQRMRGVVAAPVGPLPIAANHDGRT